jgi:LCP family protein required for cell wall assembly
MNCRDARNLLDRGITPGSSTSRRAQLGFHLASCPACRAYRENPAQQILSELLAQAPPTPIITPVASPAPISARPLPKRSHRLRYAGMALVTALLIGVSIPCGSTAFALFAIQQNVQAMRIEPSPTLPVSAGAVIPLIQATPTPETAATTATPQPAGAVVRPPSRNRAPATLVPTMPVTATPAPQRMPFAWGEPAKGRAITVLLLGIDRRPDETGPSRSDAIMIARLDPESKRVALLSLPRDLIVNIPGYGQDRINAAMVYGDLNPQLGGGVELTRKTVSTLLGIPIDYVVQIDFQGFMGVIDLIGGVTINVEKEIYDPAYPTMDYGYTVAHFLPGVQQMDGETALMYARTRHSDSDFERLKRQQAVLLGVQERLQEQNALEQVQSVAAITSALRDYVQTDLPEERMVGLAWAFQSLTPDSVERYALDGSMVTINAIPGDPYAQLAAPGAIDRLAQQLLYGKRE